MRHSATQKSNNEHQRLLDSTQIHEENARLASLASADREKQDSILKQELISLINRNRREWFLDLESLRLDNKELDYIIKLFSAIEGTDVSTIDLGSAKFFNKSKSDQSKIAEAIPDHLKVLSKSHTFNKYYLETKINSIYSRSTACKVEITISVLLCLGVLAACGFGVGSAIVAGLPALDLVRFILSLAAGAMLGSGLLIMLCSSAAQSFNRSFSPEVKDIEARLSDYETSLSLVRTHLYSNSAHQEIGVSAAQVATLKAPESFQPEEGPAEANREDNNPAQQAFRM